MDELISRKALLKELDGLCKRMSGTGKQLDWVIRNEISVVVDIVNKSPAIEAEPVRHGEWELIADCANEGVYCSNCHKKVYKADYANQKLKSKFCPNCGAKKDGGKKNDQR